MMRVALPVDPYLKTASEVATMSFVRERTIIPIPRVVAYESCQNSILGFEWVLLEFVEGHTLESKWRDLSMTTKRDLIKQLAQYQSQLFDIRYHSIGNLYHDAQQSEARPGAIVARDFFWGERIHRNIPRGPFLSNRNWLSARLNAVLEEQDKTLEEPEDDDDAELAEIYKSLATQLLDALPEIFPDNGAEATVLFHNDLSLRNILVDDECSITAIIDWECVSTLPLWRACQLPELLNGRL